MPTALTIESMSLAALELQPKARLQLTRMLVDSLAGLDPSKVHHLWLDEAERRDAERESGQVAGIPGDQVFERIRARFK